MNKENRMFEAIKTWENGNKESQEFSEYEAACKWLATSPEAGINLFEDGVAVEDFGQLQSDVEYWQ